MNNLPLIVVLDWDGTIAGNVEYQANKHFLNSLLKKRGYKAKDDGNKISKAFIPNQKLIRNGFSDFINNLTNIYNSNVYFFIYTASEATWANKEIKWVEESHNLKFQRPIFTRNDCLKDYNGIYRKSLNNIFPRIIRCINKNRLEKLTKYEKQKLFDNNILIIDNSLVFDDNQNKLLVCPDYNYTIFEDILEDFPLNSLKNVKINNYVSNLINNDKVYPIAKHNNINKELFEKYNWMSKKINSIIQQNKNYSNDKFFPYLTKLIIRNKITDFKPKIIKGLQTIINRKNI